MTEPLAQGFEPAFWHQHWEALPQPELVQRLSGWVRPRGALLMIGHAPDGHQHGDHQHGDHEHEQRPPAATVNPGPVVAALNGDEWQISSTAQTRTLRLPNGTERVSQDHVLLAQRRLS